MDYEPSCLFPMDLLFPSLTLPPDKDNNTKWQTMNPLLSFHITLFPFLLFLKKYPTSSANQACKIDVIQIQFYIYNHCQLLYITIDNLDRTCQINHPLTIIILLSTPLPVKILGRILNDPSKGFSITTRRGIEYIVNYIERRWSDRGHPRKGAGATRDARRRRRRFEQREKRTLHPRRRKGVSRARPTPLPSPSAERQYPSCDTPSYDPGFRVSRAAPGGERPRLTQTQNRSPFVALLATSPPRNPLSLPPLSPSPKEARHTRDDIPALSWGREREKER